MLYIAARSVSPPPTPSSAEADVNRSDQITCASSRDHVFAVNLATSSQQIIPQQVGETCVLVICVFVHRLSPPHPCLSSEKLPDGDSLMSIGVDGRLGRV